MSPNETYDYIYIAEWDNSVHDSHYTVHHGIKLNPGIDRAEFEQFMLEEGFSLAGNVSTRAGSVEAQWLLADVTGTPPLRFEDFDLNLGSFGNRAYVKKFIISGSWSRGGKADSIGKK